MKQVSFTFLLFLPLLCYSQQKPAADASELLINTTIKIQGQFDTTINGKKKQLGTSGTGFFFEYDFEGKKFPVIVTNYHVIQNSTTGKIIFNLTDSEGRTLYGKKREINFSDFKSYWLRHPDNNIDLAILPIGLILNEHKKLGIRLAYLPLNENLIPNDSIVNTMRAIEDIYMIGYPFGKRDEYNNTPITRKGITATPFSLNYENKKEFLADIPVYPGSSGSPIVIYNTAYADKVGNMYQGLRIVFLGINYATYSRNFEGRIVPKLSYEINTNNIIVNTSIPYNLGIIIKSETLLDFKPIIDNKYFK